MLFRDRSIFRSYILTPAVVAAGMGALLGLCGSIATLAPTTEMAVLSMLAFGVVGLAAGGLIGSIAWAIRAPAALSQLGAAYSVTVGLMLIAIIESWLTGGGKLSACLNNLKGTFFHRDDAVIYSRWICTKYTLAHLHATASIDNKTPE